MSAVGARARGARPDGRAPPSPADLATTAAAVWGRYLAAVCGGALATVAALLLALAALDRTGHLPPPPISNNLCIDEKLAFLHAAPPTAPNLLVVGSSVAWRHFDGAGAVAAVQGLRPVNGGFCALRANQAVYAANWLLDRWPGVREVVMIAAPQDFSTCRTHPDAVFDRADADAFVFDGAWRWSYYLRYFDPSSLARNTLRVAGLRANGDSLDPLVFTPFGDGPLVTGASRPDLAYSGLSGFEPQCFAALRSLALRLAAEGRRLVVATNPVHPDWKRRFDPDGAVLTAWRGQVRASLTGTGAETWDGDAALGAEAAAFTDAVHLRWPEAARFSHLLVAQMRLGARLGER